MVKAVRYFEALKYGMKRNTISSVVGLEADREWALKLYDQYLRDGLTITHTGAFLPTGTIESIDWSVDIDRDEAGNVLWGGPNENMVPFILDNRGWYRGTLVRTVQDKDGTITSTEGRKTYRMSY